MTDKGSCFGFEIHSPLSWQYLRKGSGDVLRVTRSSAEAEETPKQLLYEWLPRPGHSLHARLYRDAHLYFFWVGGMGSFVIDPESRRLFLPHVTGDPVLQEERLWGLPTGLCFLHRGDLPIHAAAANIDGSAVLLAAPGRFGKSTLSAAFHQAGHRVLSEDLSCLRLSSAISVVPGPAMLRLRRDVIDHMTLSDARVVREDGERVSLALADERRGECFPVPLRAIVLLKEATSGVVFERMPVHAAIRDLWNLAFRLPTVAGRTHCFQLVVDLARTVPAWNLIRSLRLVDLMETVDQIIKHCLPKG